MNGWFLLFKYFFDNELTLKRKTKEYLAGTWPTPTHNSLQIEYRKTKWIDRQTNSQKVIPNRWVVLGFVHKGIKDMILNHRPLIVGNDMMRCSLKENASVKIPCLFDHLFRSAGYSAVTFVILRYQMDRQISSMSIIKCGSISSHSQCYIQIHANLMWPV